MLKYIISKCLSKKTNRFIIYRSVSDIYLIYSINKYMNYYKTLCDDNYMYIQNEKSSVNISINRIMVLHCINIKLLI
jgi:hypothetical protein